MTEGIHGDYEEIPIGDKRAIVEEIIKRKNGEMLDLLSLSDDDIKWMMIETRLPDSDLKKLISENPDRTKKVYSGTRKLDKEAETAEEIDKSRILNAVAQTVQRHISQKMKDMEFEAGIGQ